MRMYVFIIVHLGPLKANASIRTGISKHGLLPLIYFALSSNKAVNRDNWAHTVSPNPNVKVYIGAPASTTAAGSGYVDASTITTIIQQTKAQYSSFGGVMLWDASQAYGMSLVVLFQAVESKCGLNHVSEWSLRCFGERRAHGRVFCSSASTSIFAVVFAIVNPDLVAKQDFYLACKLTHRR